MDGSIARRLFLKILGAASASTVASSCAGPMEGGGEGNAVTDGQQFEYIVVGSGAGGGPLASNLARQGHSVLLLEAGTDQGNRLDYQVPAFHTLSTEAPAMRWDYFVRHYADDAQQRRDTKLTPQGVWYPRSGTLGGCTAHNAMITVYPHERDWDHIAEVTGDDSWRGAAMRQYFQRVEQCRYIDSSDTARAAGHGFSGYLRTSMPDARIALADKKLLTIVASAAIAFDIDGLASALRNLFSAAAGSLSGIRSQLLGLMSSDLNTAAPDRDQTEGLFTIPLATDGMRRSGPREWILGTIAAGHPLTLWTNKLVTRVLFDDAPDARGHQRARGVEFIDAAHQYRADPAAGRTADGPRRTAIATREVILCAGAFNTPQLLMLSGIGPEEELRSHHIDVRIAAPGVGRNLQDRYEVGIVSEMGSDLAALNGCTFGRTPRAAASRDICWTRQEQPDVPAASSPDPCLVTWNNTQGGVYASNGGVVGIVKRSTPDQPVPDLFIFGLPSYFKGYEPCYAGRVTADHRHFTWAILKAHTDNTVGTVRLRSTDPRDTPDIDFHFFADGIAPDGTPRAQDLSWVTDGAAQLTAANRDLNAVVQGVKLARQIGRTTHDLMLFGQYKEVWPGPRVSSDEDIATFVRNEAWGHHASCTCPMGRVAQNEGDPDDPLAVVDSNFRVRGTCNLRIVDASVFPKIPGFFIVAPIYMIAEKATDAILADVDQNCGRA